MEEWRRVKEFYEYEVSNMGNVRRVGYTKPLRKWKHARGYECVSLSSGGKKKNRYVHRLVAEAFLGNPTGLPQVNHEDGNKTNNSVNNLSWISNEDNMAHSIEVLKIDRRRVGDESSYRKLTEAQVRQIPELLKLHSKKKVAKLLNVHVNTIQSIVTGVNWRHLNLDFSYVRAGDTECLTIEEIDPLK